MFPLVGRAKKFTVGSKSFEDVYVEIDLKGKKIVVLLPNKNCFSNQEAGKVSLSSLEIFTPHLTLKADRLENLFITHYRTPYYNPEKSPLTTLLTSKYENELLFLVPKERKLELNILLKGKQILHKEIAFEGFKYKLPPSYTFKEIFQTFGFYPYFDEEVLTVRVDSESVELNDLKSFLKLAFSYLQGAEINCIALLENTGKLHLYFTEKVEDEIFPLIPNSEEKNWIEDYLLSFYRYWLKLDYKKKRKLERLILNLINAKIKERIVSERRLAHLFFSLETALDGNIDEDRISQTLKISPYDAGFLVSLRKKIFHGYKFEEAVKEAFAEVDRKYAEENSIFNSIYNNLPLTNPEDFARVYLAAISVVDRYILETIGYKGVWINPINEFSQEYVNEILIEDEDVLEELKMR